MIINEIREKLFELQDLEYRDFQCRLMPTVDREKVIGVRTPLLRNLAKELGKRSEISEFLDALPHEYYDENQLHSFILSTMKDYSECIARVDEFLPYIDNWATSDQLSPKIFKKHRMELLGAIRTWLDGKLISGENPVDITGDNTYVIRFGIGMLMEHYLDEDFDPEYLEMVAKLRSNEYYINMMIAWLIATALAKQWEDTIPYIEKGKFDLWVHNKAIQKAIESKRITPEQKTYLRTLKK